jgi:radical SAM superfamily enzyme YgiQ (UPF0313 family)
MIVPKDKNKKPISLENFSSILIQPLQEDRDKWPHGDQDYAIVYNCSGYPPIGMVSMASNTDIPTAVIDESMNPYAIDYVNIPKHITDIGLYCTIGNYHMVLKRFKTIRESAPWVRIGFGGPYAHIMSDKILKSKDVDWCCTGYGEETWDMILKNGISEKVPNIAYKDSNNNIIRTQLKQRDLKTLKRPNFDLLKGEGENFSYRKRYHNYGQGLEKGWTVISMSSADGCPVGPQARCGFCTRVAEGYRLTGASVYAGHLKEYIKRYGKVQINETADDFFNFAFLRSLDKEITKLGISRDSFKYTFMYASAWFLTPLGLGKKKELEREKEIIRLLHALNMDNIFIGFEHRDEKILDVAKKGLTQKQQDKATDLLLSAEKNFTAGMILGLPGETEKTVTTLLNFAEYLHVRGNGRITLDPYLLTVIPPSAFWNQAYQQSSKFRELYGNTDELDITSLQQFTPDIFCDVNYDYLMDVRYNKLSFVKEHGKKKKKKWL